MKFEMKYTLQQLETISTILITDKSEDNDFKFNNLANLYDYNNNSSVHIVGDNDNGLSIVYRKNDKILNKETFNFKEVNTVGKLKRFLINKIKEYNKEN